MSRRAIVGAVAAVLAVGGAFVMLALRPDPLDPCRERLARYPELMRQMGIDSCDQETIEAYYDTAPDPNKPPTVGLENLTSRNAFAREGIKWELVGYLIWLIAVIPLSLLLVRAVERLRR